MQGNTVCEYIFKFYSENTDKKIKGNKKSNRIETKFKTY